jgi:hypothetical protein
MAYDEVLAGRIRDLIGAEPGLAERKMFGCASEPTTSPRRPSSRAGPGSEKAYARSLPAKR